jgi:hypothetical protein
MGAAAMSRAIVYETVELASTEPDAKEKARADRLLEADLARSHQTGYGSRSARRHAEIEQARRARRRSMVSRP